MADFVGFVTGGTGFAPGAPSTIEHTRSTGLSSDTVHFGDVQFTLGSIDRETAGTLIIAGSGAVATGITLGNAGIATTAEGPFILNNYMTFGNITSPSLSAAGSGRIYFDQGDNTFKVSENGGAYVDLLGVSGVGGTGTADRIAYWTNVSTITADSDLYWDNTDNRIGIGTSSPSESIDTNGAIKLDAAVNTDNGTIQYTGSDFEGRVGGAWLSLTTPPSTSGWTDSGSNVHLTSNADVVGVGVTTPDSNVKLHVSHTSSPAIKSEVTGIATNTVVAGLVLKHETTSDMTNNFGVSLQFAIEDSTPLELIVSTITSKRLASDAEAELELASQEIRINPISNYITLGSVETESGTQELRKGWGVDDPTNTADVNVGNGTGWGTGSEYTKLDTAVLYINIGTQAAVSWIPVGIQS